MNADWGSSYVCDENVNCSNTVGSYNCTCKDSFSGSGHSCSGRKLQSCRGTSFDSHSLIKPCRFWKQLQLWLVEPSSSSTSIIFCTIRYPDISTCICVQISMSAAMETICVIWMQTVPTLMALTNAPARKDSKGMKNPAKVREYKFVFFLFATCLRPHYGTIGFISLFVHESQVLVTWPSVVRRTECE